MSTTLLQCVAECFQGTGKLEGMHCLGAVSGGDSASPSGLAGRGGVMSVVRALGVLVCEGRIQGPPRGYKEGPHCAAPLQPPANNHTCEKDNYLCGRYLVLVKEIGERITIGSTLCVEVLMCSDCPCGLARSNCKDPTSLIPSTAISQWQHPSDILLEYWSIGIVPSKSPEMMNSQGLYQAVRSRLHFSQVAAWWSRSNGTKPSYVTTRIVPYNEDNPRKFRESPIEHTFPLAGIGDGNCIKVTVWALPRMEEVPTLSCPVHPIKDKDEECVARALTPTKNGPVPSASHAAEALVLPVLVDDRLQTPCDKPGKHHCHCEDEDGCPPSPSIRPNGERKRRRSLPCGPPEAGSCPPFSIVQLSSVQETVTSDTRDPSQLLSYVRYPENTIYNGRNYRADQDQTQRGDSCGFENRSYLSSGNLERCFRSQVSLEEQEGNDEKRYKPSTNDNSDSNDNAATCTEEIDKTILDFTKTDTVNDWNPVKNTTIDICSVNNTDDLQTFVPSNSQAPWTFVDNQVNGSRRFPNDTFTNNSLPVSRGTNLVINPFAEPSSFHETNPGPSSYNVNSHNHWNSNSPPCTVHHNYSRNSRMSSGPTVDKRVKDDTVKNCSTSGKDISQLMSKLSLPKEKSVKKQREEGGILDWFSKVPGRVLATPAGVGNSDGKSKPIDKKPQSSKNTEVEFKNCNLELSQREFDEVLAVLRARTPSGRRRTPVKTIRRRDRSEKLLEEQATDKNTLKNSPYAADPCVCPIHREVRRSTNSDGCLCKFCKKSNPPVVYKSINGCKNDGIQSECIYRCQDTISNAKNTNDDWRSSEDSRKGVGNFTGLGKSTESLQNASNKADVLLGAILRTSRERKGLTDISNGTRPRTVGSTEKNDLEPDPHVTTSTVTDPRIIPFEDEKSLPSVLNKRLHRFKQLFKKEWEKRELLTTEIRSKESVSNLSQDSNNLRTTKVSNNVTPRNEQDIYKTPRENRVKRKIDFTNYSVGIGKSEQPYEELVDDSISETHQNSHLQSTNYKSKDSNHRKAYAKDSTLSSAQCETQDDWRDASTLATPITLQNGCSSTRSRNNNESIDVDGDEDEAIEKGVPSAIEQEQFRRSLENAASMVFHSRTGLPLTSSPAPLRRGSCCFDYDSSLNSVSSKRSALFELNTPPSPGAVSLEETDREIENSGEGEETPKRTSTSRSRPQSHALLGSFEESALNGRLEPVSTVHGFTAELGASGSFCPKHRKLPVTVFFYTLGDNDKVSTPYLAHINLGKGYQVPRSGTIQVTLLNPLGTVVKMFVVLYDLSDMPPRSHTFLRQRTLRDKTLRYLVHLRFTSGKSGRIYLHTDIRMIICRKSDVDTASDFGSEPPKELRSYIHGPTNPKFSPRC